MKQKIFIALLFITSFTFNASAQLKGDPWIFQAYKELYNRQPSAWELNINNYNGGTWGSYGELKSYVAAYQQTLSSQGITVSTTALANNQWAVLFNQNGKTFAADLVAQGGGNLVAQGGGNLVAQGGGNLVAQGGGNLKSVPGVGFGGNFGTLAVGTKRIPVSGKGAWIIK